MSRTHTVVVNKYQSPYDVDICRPGPWGNPYSHLPLSESRATYHVDSPEEAAGCYEAWMRYRLFTGQFTPAGHPDLTLRADIEALDGLRLGCVCGEGKPCHGQVLRKLVKELKELGPDELYGKGYGAR